MNRISIPSAGHVEFPRIWRKTRFLIEQFLSGRIYNKSKIVFSPFHLTTEICPLFRKPMRYSYLESHSDGDYHVYCTCCTCCTLSMCTVRVVQIPTKTFYHQSNILKYNVCEKWDENFITCLKFIFVFQYIGSAAVVFFILYYFMLILVNILYVILYAFKSDGNIFKNPNVNVLFMWYSRLQVRLVRSDQTHVFTQIYENSR